MLSLMRTMLEQLYMCICVHYLRVNLYIHVYLTDANVEICHSCASCTGRCTYMYMYVIVTYIYMYDSMFIPVYLMYAYIYI